MQYRREIDGLRALAVVAVVLFHAGFKIFQGGFTGVDVFFVISGYLISSIILGDLQARRFSIAHFYVRRARRILPALFTIMAVTTLPACLWMLPDELKNYGQSLIATTLYSNNILLMVTSGYWAMASEFKPLLHTWSLGVEEQYYFFYPLLLMLCWSLLRKRISLVLGALALVSFVAAQWYIIRNPGATFYLLPTRAWELFAGGLTAVHLMERKQVPSVRWKTEALSGLGIFLVIVSAILTPTDPLQAQRFIVVPVLGTVLIVLFASEANFAGRLLGNKALVGIGLISYSLYLWHQPLFALARVYSRNQPGFWTNAILILAAVAFSYCSWRFVERPCRDQKRVGTRKLLTAALACSVIFVAFGVYLEKSYGMLSTVYNPALAPISAIDKRIYNSRVFQLEKSQFADPDKLRVLVIGNSLGRDFVNMTLETFDTRAIDIIYQDFQPCVYPYKSATEKALYSEADVVVFASWKPDSSCTEKDVRFLLSTQKQFFFIGTKDFGYNLNWIKRLSPSLRANQYNVLPRDATDLDARMAAEIPPEHFISLLTNTVKNGDIPITDGRGFLLSPDRIHVTKFGAIYFGRLALLDSPYGLLLKNRNAQWIAHTEHRQGTESDSP